MTDSSLGASAPVVFHFVSQSIRVVVIDEVPWFVAKDVAEALGYANPTDAITRHCKGVVKRYPLSTPGGIQEVRILSEPNVYRLVAGSNLPQAEKFEAWLFEEVLPAIRQTGRYEIPAPVGPAEEPISAADRNNLAWLVSGAAVGLHGQQAWEWAIWKSLRDVTGCPSPQPFKVHQLPTIVVELRRILAITSALQDAQIETCKQVIRRCLRHREDTETVLREMQAILDQAAQETEAVLISRLSRWQDEALTGLLARQ